MQLQLDEDGSSGSGLLTYGSMWLLWLLRQMVLAGGEEHLMYDAESIRRSVKDLAFPRFCTGEIQEAVSSLAGYERSPQSLICTDGSSLFCQTLFN